MPRFSRYAVCPRPSWASCGPLSGRLAQAGEETRPRRDRGVEWQKRRQNRWQKIKGPTGWCPI